MRLYDHSISLECFFVTKYTFTKQNLYFLEKTNKTLKKQIKPIKPREKPYKTNGFCNWTVPLLCVVALAASSALLCFPLLPSASLCFSRLPSAPRGSAKTHLEKIVSVSWSARLSRNARRWGPLRASRQNWLARIWKTPIKPMVFDVFRWSRPSCSSLLKCYFSLFVVIGAGNMCWAEGWSCRADLLRLLAEPTIGLFCCYYWLVCMRNSFDACSLIKAFFPKLVVFAPVNWLIKVFSCDTDAIGPSSCYLFYCL